MIEHSNFGPVYVLAFAFFGFFFTFLIFTVVMTSFTSIFGFIRNTLSTIFHFSTIFSMNFFNFLINTCSTLLFVVGNNL